MLAHVWDTRTCQGQAHTTCAARREVVVDAAMETSRVFQQTGPDPSQFCTTSLSPWRRQWRSLKLAPRSLLRSQPQGHDLFSHTLALLAHAFGLHSNAYHQRARAVVHLTSTALRSRTHLLLCCFLFSCDAFTAELVRCGVRLPAGEQMPIPRWYRLWLLRAQGPMELCVAELVPVCLGACTVERFWWPAIPEIVTSPASARLRS